MIPCQGFLTLFSLTDDTPLTPLGRRHFRHELPVAGVEEVDNSSMLYCTYHLARNEPPSRSQIAPEPYDSFDPAPGSVAAPLHAAQACFSPGDGL